MHRRWHRGRLFRCDFLLEVNGTYYMANMVRWTEVATSSWAFRKRFARHSYCLYQLPQKD